MRTRLFIWSCLCGLVLQSARPVNADDSKPGPDLQPPKKVVLIAGEKSHGPVGNGIHDYPWSVKLLKVMLDNSNIRERVRVEFHTGGWPENQATLQDADTIMIISDGRDGDRYKEAPHFRSPERAEFMARQMKRGCGFITFHFSTFAPDKYGEQILDWCGGYFDWETDGQRDWYSAIQTVEAEVKPAVPGHPVLRGVEPFRMKEEFYYNIRFRPDDERLTPLWIVPALKGREPNGSVVAWARQREDGGRGFGTTCGHFYENWKHENFRTMILNAIAWTAGMEVPEGGVQGGFFTHDEINWALQGIEGTERAALDRQQIRALILTGAQHPAHDWKATTAALKEVLARDRRMQVDVSTDIEDLASDGIDKYDLLVLNYCNWKKPGLSDRAQQGFVKYLKGGGGLVLIHFANGAFHFSLPEAADSDWPEYRTICRRVWNHEGESGHDAYGRFTVEIADGDHPITRGLKDYETTDELYFRQEGDKPIHVLAHARSQETGEQEPMAFVYKYGTGRVFQTVLGHAAESIRNPGTAALIRRGSVWAADYPQLPQWLLPKTGMSAAPNGESQEGRSGKSDDSSSGNGPTPRLLPGRFGHALNAAQGGFVAEANPAFGRLPFTVELWAKLTDGSGERVLLANGLQDSRTYWDLVVDDDGRLTGHLSGFEPGVVKTERPLEKGVWHYIALTLQADRGQLYVDGKLVRTTELRVVKRPAQLATLTVGMRLQEKKPSPVLIDDVRITSGVRDIVAVPQRPLSADNRTLALWNFDESEEDYLARWTPGGETNQRDLPYPQRIAEYEFETDKDWSDGRWQQTEKGPFVTHSTRLPGREVGVKNLVVFLGRDQDGAVIYDLDRCAAIAGVTEARFQIDPMRFGLLRKPTLQGDVQFHLPPAKAWRRPSVAESGRVQLTSLQRTDLDYRGLYRHGGRVVLHYTVLGTDIWDTLLAGTAQRGGRGRPYD